MFTWWTSQRHFCYYFLDLFFTSVRGPSSFQNWCDSKSVVWSSHAHKRQHPLGRTSGRHYAHIRKYIVRTPVDHGVRIRQYHPSVYNGRHYVHKRQRSPDVPSRHFCYYFLGLFFTFAKEDLVLQSWCDSKSVVRQPIARLTIMSEFILVQW